MPLWVLLLGGGAAAYLLLSSSSSAPLDGGGYAPSAPATPSGAYGGPTTFGPGGSTTPVGPAAVSSTPSPAPSSWGGFSSTPAPSAPVAPTVMTDETMAQFPNLDAGQAMSQFGGAEEDPSGGFGFPSASATGTAAGSFYDPLSKRWY